MNPPTPDQIKQARESATHYRLTTDSEWIKLDRRLSQARAAKLIGVITHTWKSYERGRSPMNAAYWELFQLKIKD